MTVWAIFAICFTTLLLAMGSTLTFVEFYRADKKWKEAELKTREGRKYS